MKINLRIPLFILILLSFHSGVLNGAGNDTIYVNDLNISNNTKVYYPGESLKYQLYYGIVNAGEATLTVTETRLERKNVHHLVMNAYSTGLANRIYRLNNSYESFVDPSSGLPVKSIRDVNEGSHSRYTEVLYEREKNIVISTRSGNHDVPSDIMDKIAVFYKLRNILGQNTFKEGDVIVFQTFISEEVYPMLLRYMGIEEVRTKSGSYEALKFMPVAEPGKVLKSENAITIWLSNDPNFVPVKLKLNMFIGSVNADIIEYSGLRTGLNNSR